MCAQLLLNFQKSTLEQPAKTNFLELHCSWWCFLWRLIAGDGLWWSWFTLTVLRHWTSYLVQLRRAVRKLGSAVTEEHPGSLSESSNQYPLPAKVSLAVGCVPAYLVSGGKSVQMVLCLHNSPHWQPVLCMWILQAAFWEKFWNHGWKWWLVLSLLPIPTIFLLEQAPLTDDSPVFFTAAFIFQYSQFSGWGVFYEYYVVLVL